MFKDQPPGRETEAVVSSMWMNNSMALSTELMGLPAVLEREVRMKEEDRPAVVVIRHSRRNRVDRRVWWVVCNR
jgi:hypothetical protein